MRSSSGVRTVATYNPPTASTIWAQVDWNSSQITSSRGGLRHFGAPAMHRIATKPTARPRTVIPSPSRELKPRPRLLAVHSRKVHALKTLALSKSRQSPSIQTSISASTLEENIALTIVGSQHARRCALTASPNGTTTSS